VLIDYVNRLRKEGAGALEALVKAGVGGISQEETTPVGSFGVANNFGLYDMHGNVSEWCADSWHSSYEGAPIDGSVWEDKHKRSSHFRMLRGGSWGNISGNCRSAFRNFNEPNSKHISFLGFRVVCTEQESSSSFLPIHLSINAHFWKDIIPMASGGNKTL
ncbi:MAG: formylglycine-generating enzyme family protein, partial [Symploca sp. SIO3E6]|nr:formylglycine-generating enzyme family protein [Caldora sp. SIO3E6]